MVDIVREGKKEKPLWIKYLNQRIRQNKNWLCIITGQTGSGKSWSALSLAEMIDPEFNIDRCIFSGRDLMKLINSKKLKKGSVIIWDEAGVDLSNRDWQSLTNRILNFLLQTFRHKCFILFFTTPYMDFVDSNTRKLFHAEMRCISIDYNKKTTTLNPQLIQYNPRMQKFYYKYLKVIEKGGGLATIERLVVSKPSKELIDKYEAKKDRFTSELNADIERQLNRVYAKKKLKSLTELQEKILGCWNKGVFKQIDIAKELNKQQSEISRSEQRMGSKGYNKDNHMKTYTDAL